jgi:hypothetical protein
MTKNYLVWVAWMSRWGQATPEDAYPHSVHDSPEGAEAAGAEESQYRGGKYKFQHSPCYLNLGPGFSRACWAEDPIAAQPEVLVCWVSLDSLSLFGERTHLVGIFDSEEGARHAANLLYPGWDVKAKWMPVVRGSRA